MEYGRRDHDQDQRDDHCSLVWGNDETKGTAVGLTENGRTWKAISDVREGNGCILFVIVVVSEVYSPGPSLYPSSSSLFDNC